MEEEKVTLPLSNERQEKIRAYWVANPEMTQPEMAARFACSVQQVRTAIRGAPMTPERQAKREHGQRGAELRESRRRR